jgi:hypothetical protein
VSRRRFNVFRDGHVYVMARQCDTCIFRPGSEVIPPERLAQMRREAVKAQTSIVCHHTVGTKANAVCRGFYNTDQSAPLHVAQAMGLVRFQKC